MEATRVTKTGDNVNLPVGCNSLLLLNSKVAQHVQQAIDSCEINFLASPPPLFVRFVVAEAIDGRQNKECGVLIASEMCTRMLQMVVHSRRPIRRRSRRSEEKLGKMTK